MKSRLIRFGFAVTAAGAALVLGAGGAAADTPPTFTIAGHKAVDGVKLKVQFSPAPSTTTVVTDATSGQVLTCGSPKLPGFFFFGTGQSGTDIGTALANGWGSSCFITTDLQVSFQGSGLWQINFGAGGTTGVSGTISKFALNFQTSTGTCSWKAKGSVPIKITNERVRNPAFTTMDLQSTRSNLTVSGVAGTDCAGFPADGDKLNIAASLQVLPVNAGYGPLRFTADPVAG